MTLKTAIKRAQRMSKKEDNKTIWYVILNRETGRFRAVPKETLSFLITTWNVDLEIIDIF